MDSTKLCHAALIGVSSEEKTPVLDHGRRSTRRRTPHRSRQRRDYGDIDLVAGAAGRKITPRWVPGPVGVQSRNFGNDRIEALGYLARYDLAAGLAETYPWVAEQVRLSRP